jgi:hypothetical protein
MNHNTGADAADYGPGKGAHAERPGSGIAGQSRRDHVVVVVFENRSLDNVLGRLYGPVTVRPSTA